jgi:hypothetical protein
MTLNEEKLAELQKAVAAELNTVDYEKKGCFGTLLCNENDDYCRGCADRIPCKAAMEATEGALIAEIDKAAEKAEATEVDAKLAETMEIENQEKAEVKASPEPAETCEYVQGGNDKMRVRGAEVNGFEFKIKSKIKVDWNTAVSEVFGKKPTSFRQIAAIVRGYVDKGYSASAYGWTNKLIQRLAAQGVIEYNADAKLIAWV